MVGGLVEQQHLGVGDQRLRQRHAPDLAAGQALRNALGRHAELLEQDVGAVASGLAALGLGQTEQDQIGERRGRRQHRLLWQIGGGHARLDEHLAAVEFGVAGQHAQQGRLAGAVAAHQTDAIAARQHRVQPGEQFLLADAQPCVLQGEDRWCHARARGFG